MSVLVREPKQPGNCARRLIIVPGPEERDRWEKSAFPSCFFNQQNTENVSAVLFTNAGTMPKFNRMGVLADFGDPSVRLIRKNG